jgi:hypothetical protein
MKLLFLSLIAFVIVSFRGNQVTLDLTGQKVGSDALLTWNFSTDEGKTPSVYTVQRKENQGNLKNYWATLATYSSDFTDGSFPLVKGTNTFRVHVRCTDGSGYFSNQLSFK